MKSAESTKTLLPFVVIITLVSFLVCPLVAFADTSVNNSGGSRQVLTTSSVVNAGKCGTNLNWTLDSNGHLKITGSGKMNSNPSFSQYSSTIKSVTLPEGLENVGSGAFEDAAINEVVIPSTVKNIGESAFRNCLNLRTVHILSDSKLEQIAAYAFDGCESLSSVSTPDYYLNVKTIGHRAFTYCNSLTSFPYMPKATSIGGGYNDLRFTFGDTISGLDPFLITCGRAWNSSNSNYDNWLLYADGTLVLPSLPESFSNASQVPWSKYADKIERVILNDSIKTIPAYAFYKCSNLMSYDLPYNITTVGAAAFAFSGLRNFSVTYDSNLASVDETAFYGCYALVVDCGYNSMARDAAVAAGCTTVHAYGELSQASIDSDNDADYFEYNGKAVTPCIGIYYEDFGYLREGYDYVVTYKNNINAGAATATITGKNCFSGTKVLTYKIKPIHFESAVSLDYESSDAAISGTPKQYTGKAHTLKLVYKRYLESGEITLKEGIDYTASYKSNINAGTATCTVTGKGNYKGSTTITFDIEPANIEYAIVSNLQNKKYTGKPHTQNPKVTLNGKVLKEGTDYTVEYYDNTAKGYAQVVAYGQGNYQGSASGWFAITGPGWNSNQSGWRYMNNNGSWVKNTWKKINGKWYAFDSWGYARTGWFKSGGKWYYLDYNSCAMKTGWVKTGGKWYYLNKSGVMQKGWKKISGKWYYLKSNGAMAQNEWYKGYWLGSSGAWTYKAKGKWSRVASGRYSGNWVYSDSSGWQARNSYVVIDGYKYRFNSQGFWVGRRYKVS